MTRKSAQELLWKEFFRDPSQWWDNRHCKIHATHPDFKHKFTKECLWIDGWCNLQWICEELKTRGLAQVRGKNNEGAAFVALLRACSKDKDLSRGIRLHDDILRRGLLETCVDALVTMYAKCGALVKAQTLFDKHKSRDVYTWTALISGYASHGQGQEALNYYERMLHLGLSPDAVTYTSVLKACGSLKAVDKGELINDEIAKKGLLGSDIVLGNALVDMYVKCGALTKARQMLEELPARSVISWTVLIAGYAGHGEGQEALNCFNRMKSDGIFPNATTFACILKACGSIRAAEEGEKIHDEISKQGLLETDVVLGNSLVDMYAKCGALASAREVLEQLPIRDVISWTPLIAGYAECGDGEEALDCFARMERDGISPDAKIYTCALKACGIIGATDQGEKFHDEIAKQGLLGKDIALGNALVDMYARCGSLAKAHRVLKELPVRDVLSWTPLIAGYTEYGKGHQALDCLEKMQCEGLFPNAVTYFSILRACGSIGAVKKGEKIHEEISQLGLLRGNIVLGNALIDMYAKCGALAKAQQLLEELPLRNVFSWTALIGGYADRGQNEEALDCFKKMRQEGLSPDAATLACVLGACSRLGRAEDVEMHLEDMSSKYDIKPDLEHYACMIDVYGRVGYLDRAVRVIEKMPSTTSAIWSALLSACLKWGDVEVGRWAFDRAAQLDKSDGAIYVLMADIYSAAGMQEDAEQIEAMRKENKARKKSMQNRQSPISCNIRPRVEMAPSCRAQTE